MVRKCSHCGLSGHNSRTCLSSRVHGGGGVRLFGMQLLLGDHHTIKESFSMHSISYPSSSSTSLSTSSSSSSSSSLASMDEATQSISNGYLFEGHGGRPQERKKGVPWSEEEHRSFLTGLEELGKGDWRGISRKFVMTRTPTQIASHAQKFFLRQSSLDGRKRRTSLFDVVTICQKACQKAVPSNSKSKRDKPAAPFDLNSLSQEEEIELPSCLNLFSQSSGSIGRMPARLDLELRLYNHP